eukprot:10230778-Alexandrium_andersonii.AAC.1
MRLRSQQSPKGKPSLFRAWTRRKTRAPGVSALRAGGTALRAAPPAPRASTEGVPVFCRFQALNKD